MSISNNYLISGRKLNKMKKRFLKRLITLLSFTLFLNIISPSITSAQTSTYKPQTPIENLQPEETNLEIQPMVLGFVVRIVIQSGSRFLKVSRGGTLLATHKLVIHAGKQGKHIVGHSNFIVGRSILSADANALLKSHAGKGTMINEYKERVNFGKIIGEYYNDTTKHYYPTTKGIIHYSKTGAHIVPSAP